MCNYCLFISTGLLEETWNDGIGAQSQIRLQKLFQKQTDVYGRLYYCLGHSNLRSGDWKAGGEVSASCLGAGGFALEKQRTTWVTLNQRPSISFPELGKWALFYVTTKSGVCLWTTLPALGGLWGETGVPGDLWAPLPCAVWAVHKKERLEGMCGKQSKGN